MKVTIRNEQLHPVMYTITDRPVEVKTSSLSAGADMVPPMSTLSLHLQEGEVIVLTAEGGIKIEAAKEENNG